MNTMKVLKIGDKIKYCGGESQTEPWDWIMPGMIGVVKKHHPEVRGTGVILDDEENLVDNGLSEWWEVDFGKAGPKCVEKNSVGKGKTFRVIKEEL